MTAVTFGVQNSHKTGFKAMAPRDALPNRRRDGCDEGGFVLLGFGSSQQHSRRGFVASGSSEPRSAPREVQLRSCLAGSTAARCRDMRRGKEPRGSQHPSAKLSEADIEQLRQLRAEGHTHRELA